MSALVTCLAALLSALYFGHRSSDQFNSCEDSDVRLRLRTFECFFSPCIWDYSDALFGFSGTISCPLFCGHLLWVEPSEVIKFLYQ